MSWLYGNINHFTVPLGILLGLMATLLGLRAQRLREAGIPGPYLSDATRNIAIVVIVICGVLLGVALVKNRA